MSAGRETVHYGPIGQCRTHRMTQDCEGASPDCLIEKMPTRMPTFAFMTEEEATRQTTRLDT